MTPHQFAEEEIPKIFLTAVPIKSLDQAQQIWIFYRLVHVHLDLVGNIGNDGILPVEIQGFLPGKIQSCRPGVSADVSLFL